MPICAAAFDHAADDLGDARVIGDRGADQADPARLGRDAAHHLVRRHDAHAAVGRPPHHAVGAAARAAARRLGHEHRRQLGVRRQDLRARRQKLVRRGHHRRHRVAIALRHVEAGTAGQGRHHRVAAPVRPHRLDQLERRLLRLAQGDHVAERGQRHRVGERQRTAGRHHRVLGTAIGRQRRDAGQLQAAHHAGQLELVGDREGEQRIAAGRPVALEGEQRPGRGVVVGQHGAVGGDAGHAVEPAVDGLVAERRHRGPVGARIDQSQPELGLLADGAGLRLQVLARADTSSAHGGGNPSTTVTTQQC